MMFSIPLLLIVGMGVYLGYRAVRALETRPTGRLSPAHMEERTRRLEEQMATLTDQMQRLAESQEFTTKLLTDRK